MKLNRYSLLFVIYVIILFAFSIYSYSQIDLNLTLSANSIYQSFQRQLIQLGYFNRPLSAGIYFILIFLLFISYFLFLRLVGQKKLTKANILWLIIGSSVILFFAYPAFSHDIFNYMFDARIVTKYFSNPYFYSAQNFPSDLWIRFMHWTHRTYPYGPFWLLITLPFSFLGFGKFVLTLINFKLMFTLFHFGNIYLIYKILRKVSPVNALFGLTFYAFNPLIIIESLLSPHNEVIMLFFLLLAIYFWLTSKKLWRIVTAIFLSAGIKFITVILLPIFFLEKKRLSSGLRLMLIFLLSALLIQTYLREPYPWYFIPPIGMAVLIPEAKYIRNILVGLSFGLLLRYLPYLYQGDYSNQVKFQQNVLFSFPIIMMFMWVLFHKLSRKTML